MGTVYQVGDEQPCPWCEEMCVCVDVNDEPGQNREQRWVHKDRQQGVECRDRAVERFAQRRHEDGDA